MFGLLCWALGDECAGCSVMEVEAPLEDMCNFSSEDHFSSLPPYYLLKQGFTTKQYLKHLKLPYYFNIHYMLGFQGRGITNQLARGFSEYVGSPFF